MNTQPNTGDWDNEDYPLSKYRPAPKPKLRQPQQQCLHDACTQCHGTGIKDFDGSLCVHHISCTCPKCRVMC